MKFLLAAFLAMAAFGAASASTVYTVETTTPLYGTASFTGVVGATFTGSTSPQNAIVATSVTGTIAIGDVISGTGITAGTTIIAQVSGTPGGAGTYTGSVANTTSAASVTDTSTQLHASSITGTLFPGQVLAGTGLSGSPTILSQLSGSTGGTGVYNLSAGFQIASEAMTGGTQSFTGPVHDLGLSPINNYRIVGCIAVADVTGTLKIQTSNDNSTWRSINEVTMYLLSTKYSGFVFANVQAEYYRCAEVNGATLQTTNLVNFSAGQ